MEEAFELGGQAGGLLLAIDAAGAHIAHGDGGAEHLSRFFFGEVADEFGEERQAVHLGEEDIDRQVDAEGLRHLAEAGAQIARGGGGALLGARPGEVFGIVADQDGARRLASWLATPARGCSLRIRRVHLAGSAGSLPPASTKIGASREPEVGGSRGHEDCYRGRPGRRAIRVRARR